MNNQPVALVTGATSGFGLETARLLAQKGYKVYGTFRSPSKTGDLKQIAGAVPIYLDVTKDYSVLKAVGVILKKEGRVDVLVNNAGFVVAGFLEDISDQDLRDQFDTNVLGILRVTRAVVPAMRQRGFGKIVNIGSISGRVAFPGIGAYAASKSMVRSLTEGLRQELRPFGIDVAEIAPGTFATKVVSSTRYGKNAQSPNSHYKTFTSEVKDKVKESFEHAAPARKVAELIGKITAKKTMKPVYVIGLDAVVMAFLKKRLPDFLFEWLFTRVFTWSRFPGS